MLKADHGLGHGNANLIAIRAREAAAGGAPSEDELVESHYAGKNAELRAAYDAVIAEVTGYGPDVELAPKKTYVSLRRRKQFASVGPVGGSARGLPQPPRQRSDRAPQADHGHGHASCPHPRRVRPGPGASGVAARGLRARLRPRAG